AAGLADGESRLSNVLESEDIRLTMGGLQKMGVRIDRDGDAWRVHGTAGRLTGADEIFLGNSGTSMRFFTALAALATGETVLTGTERMQERPVADLLDALALLKVPVRCLRRDGCPPISVTGGKLTGGSVAIRCGVSSQYLSALLLTAPCTTEGMDIRVTEGPVSKPYIDMTLAVMERLGVSVDREGYNRFRVPGGQTYRAGQVTVETDASNASYFWAAAAVTGGEVTVRGIGRDSIQGDVKLSGVLARMGCRVADHPDGLTVTGGELAAIEVDMADMPDMVPTLAVVAAFAQGTTRIRNVGHLRAKECDRLTAVATELGRMGARVATTETDLTVTGGDLHGARIRTYDDHRMAMCFAVAGLAVPGVVIEDETCVRKSFPGFWEVFETL
ncbi:MAG TPA: 3-phosphoshikimate 1-carboxyvinyltransferase, partial [Desulfosarcina sp.]|nr:3-phosphoshikimate 1-carboxyvinyltransferase [Desulfosarcina sp.]